MKMTVEQIRKVAGKALAEWQDENKDIRAYVRTILDSHRNKIIAAAIGFQIDRWTGKWELDEDPLADWISTQAKDELAVWLAGAMAKMPPITPAMERAVAAEYRSVWIETAKDTARKLAYEAASQHVAAVLGDMAPPEEQM